MRRSGWSENMERAFNQIVAAAGEARSIEIADLNRLLPENVLSSEDIEALVLALAEEGIELRVEPRPFPEISKGFASTLAALIAVLPPLPDGNRLLLQRLIDAQKYTLAIDALGSALKDLGQPLNSEQYQAFAEAAGVAGMQEVAARLKYLWK